MRKEKGITLIALIITIIVMLILAGVTVSVALNGGLFKTAKDAAKDTQYELDYETLQAGIVGALDNKELKILTAQSLVDNLPSGWDVSGENGGPYTAISLKGNEFIVYNDGNIETPVSLDEYVFGKDGKGRSLNDTSFFDLENMTFTDKSLNVEFLNMGYIPINIEEATEDNSFIYVFYIKYNEEVYKFQTYIDEDEGVPVTNPLEGLKLVYKEQEGTNVGKSVKYDGKDWIVLYDDDTNGLQLITVDVLEPKSVWLGCSDTTIDESEVEDIDGDGKKSDLEKAIYSYNHAIETLNSKCASLVTDKSKIEKDSEGNYKIRSVGSNPTNPESENKTLFTLEGLENSAIYNRIYSADDNYVSDYDRMTALDIINNEENFWLASRIIMIDHGLSVRVSGYPLMSELIDEDSAYSEYCNKGVRPVITLEPGALDGLAGEGTVESPLILQ